MTTGAVSIGFGFLENGVTDVVKLPPGEDQLGLIVLARFMEALSPLRLHDCIFRGQGKEYAIIPKAFRDGQIGIVSRDDLDHWASLVSRLPVENGDVALLALAQHYNIPTTLLDWTANPLLALYFACEDLSDGVAAVFAAPKSQFQTLRKLSSVNVFKEDRRRLALIDAGRLNSRALAQDSWMTIHPLKSATFTNLFNVFEVQPGEKRNVLAALAHFGLSRPRVYSDVVSAASAMEDWLKASVEQEW